MGIETTSVKAWINKEGIMEVYFKPNKGFGTADSWEFDVNMWGLAKKPCPVLYDLREIGHIENETTKRMGDEFSNKMIKALAVLIKPTSIRIRILSLILPRIVKINYPVKLFTKREDALEWLKKYV